jgi:hypothetical protein
MIKDFGTHDSYEHEIVIRQDTIRHLSDSSSHKLIIKSDFPAGVKSTQIKPFVSFIPADTASFCSRGSIADVTFSDSTNIVTRLDPGHLQDFPFIFTGINRIAREESKAELIHHLKEGERLPPNLYKNDWILPLIVVTVFIYGVVFSESASFFRGIFKFIFFRGINESASRDISSIFQWQSSIFNLAAFINISIFAFLSSVWSGLIFLEDKPFLLWLICFGVVVSSLTVRHLICSILGNMSGEKEIFREYLVAIYQYYRLAALFLLIISGLILYTVFIPKNILFYTGFSFIALLYTIRVFRLFLIFINRHVSIFYLILYLCALEILPFVIIIKYVTGLV